MADCELDPDDYKGTKEQRVRQAFSGADDAVAKRLAAEFVELLSTSGHFDQETDLLVRRFTKLQKAFDDVGATLTSRGQLTWNAPQRAGAVPPSSSDQPPQSGGLMATRRAIPKQSVIKAPPSASVDPASSKNTIFIVYGHDKALRDDVELRLRKWKIPELDVVILDDLPTGGASTLIEKFERYATTAKFAIVIATPDDVGEMKTKASELQPRARQNVILEMGYFLGSLGRDRVVFLNGGVEVPSDLGGLLRIDTDTADWSQRLARELRDAGIEVDYLG